MNRLVAVLLLVWSVSIARPTAAPATSFSQDLRLSVESTATLELSDSEINAEEAHPELPELAGEHTGVDLADEPSVREEIQLSELPRPPPRASDVDALAYDTATNLTDPVDDLGRVQRVSTDLEVQCSAPRMTPSPADAADLIRSATPTGRELADDVIHRSAPWAVDDVATNGSVFRVVGGDEVERTLIQVPGELNGTAGRFGWIVEDASNLAHQRFVPGGAAESV